MVNSVSNPRVVLSQSGDALIIQGPASPILFIPHTHLGAVLNAPESVAAVIISDVGAAAVEALLAAGAAYHATTATNVPDIIESLTLRFVLPNGLTVAYTTDESLATSRERLSALGIDLAVTNNSIEWLRQHSELIGTMIARVPTTPSQMTGLHQFDAQRIATAVRAALDQQSYGGDGL